MAYDNIPVASKTAKRLGTFIQPVTFYNEGGNTVTPNSVAWTLYDQDGDVVNSRTAVSETPDTTVYIVLSGNDLPCSAGSERWLRLYISAPYDSPSHGSGLPLIGQIKIKVEDK